MRYYIHPCKLRLSRLWIFDDGIRSCCRVAVKFGIRKRHAIKGTSVTMSPGEARQELNSMEKSCFRKVSGRSGSGYYAVVLMSSRRYNFYHLFSTFNAVYNEHFSSLFNHHKKYQYQPYPYSRRNYYVGRYSHWNKHHSANIGFPAPES